MFKLLLGLGNPGRQYAKTRHNAGAWLVDALLERYSGSLKLHKKFQAAMTECRIAESNLRVMCPTTWMNHSGLSVAAVAKFYKISPAEILVAHDDLDFSAGLARLKQGGGHGGHNGLRDMIAALGSANFYRIRLGIGHPGQADGVSDYVLHAPSERDRVAITQSIELVISCFEALLAGDWAAVQKRLHSQ